MSFYKKLQLLLYKKSRRLVKFKLKYIDVV